jgi:ribose 1,5-bisphosphokinase
MSSAPFQICPAASGKLVLVVGPSGAGKDSLLDRARADLAGDARFVFARRVITRIARDEDHDTVTNAEFDEIRNQGGFLLHWSAYGLCYGLPIALRDDLATGRIVVANASRSVITDAEAMGLSVSILHITASPSVLAGRIAGRGRETREDIEARLSRQPDVETIAAEVRSICNDGPLDHGCRLFMEALLDCTDPAMHAQVS